MSDEQNKYYKRITNKHTSLIVNLLISSINIMSGLYSSPVFGFVDSHIVVHNYLCLQQPLFFQYRKKILDLSLKKNGTTDLEIKQENYHEREIGLWY